MIMEFVSYLPKLFRLRTFRSITKNHDYELPVENDSEGMR
jgi:hypothetical protein